MLLSFKFLKITFYLHVTLCGLVDTYRNCERTFCRCLQITVVYLIWSIALYSAETWTLRATDQKRLESFEMWCWRRTEKIIWADHVRNEVLLRVNEQRNILHEIRK